MYSTVSTATLQRPYVKLPWLDDDQQKTHYDHYMTAKAKWAEKYPWPVVDNEPPTA